MSFQWVHQSQPCPGPRVPGLCLFLSSPSRSPPPPAGSPSPPRAAWQGVWKPWPPGSSLGPACSPSPFLKMMPTAPSLPASSLLYMTHRGFILESMKVHCSTLRGRHSQQRALPKAWGWGRGGPGWGLGLTRLQPAGCWGRVGTASGTGPPGRSPGACTGASAPWSGAWWSSGSSL